MYFSVRLLNWEVKYKIIRWWLYYDGQHFRYTYFQMFIIKCLIATLFVFHSSTIFCAFFASLVVFLDSLCLLPFVIDFFFVGFLLFQHTIWWQNHVHFHLIYSSNKAKCIQVFRSSTVQETVCTFMQWERKKMKGNEWWKLFIVRND